MEENNGILLGDAPPRAHLHIPWMTPPPPIPPVA